MRYLIALACIFTINSASAQVLEVLQVVKTVASVSGVIDAYATNRQALKSLDELSESLEEILLNNNDQLIEEIDNVPYRTIMLEILHRSKANRIRIQEYVEHCSERSDWCGLELEELLLSGRQVSAEARTLEISPLTVSIVVSSSRIRIVIGRFRQLFGMA